MTTRAEVKTHITQAPHIWCGGGIWTLRIGDTTQGLYATKDTTVPGETYSTYANLALAVLVAGCIPVPPGHVGDTRANLDDDAATWIVKGRTTRADAIMHFGEPDGGTDACGTLWWQALDRAGGGLLLIPVPSIGVMGAAGATAMRLRRLIVWFAADGRASGSLLQTGYCYTRMSGFANAGGVRLGVPAVDPANAAGIEPVPLTLARGLGSSSLSSRASSPDRAFKHKRDLFPMSRRRFTSPECPGSHTQEMCA